MISQILFYGQPFLLGFAIASVLSFIIVVLFRKFPLDNKRIEDRHIHKKNISRFGGMAIIVAVIVSIFFNQYLFFDNIVWSIIAGGLLILLYGIFDDIKPLSWQSQMFSQVAIVLLVFIMGIHTEFISNPFGGVVWLVKDENIFFSLIFMLVWMLVIMNAVNWSDGVDGLAGGIVIIASFTLLFVSLQPNVSQPPIALLAAIFAGSVFGFLIFNLPPAQIFAGSSGSFFMGYVVALLAIAAGAKIGATLLVLAVPLIDAVWVVWQRIKKGSSVFKGDKEHLHYKLLDKGWSVWAILLLYYGITIMSAIIAIYTQMIGKVVALGVFCFIILIFFINLSHNDKEQGYI
jgi:UDP-GlcNAc:undecaprenyl-phosphate GlcNAc-1-phosphate transferase